MSSPEQQLAHAAAMLESSPGDLDAWLEVAARLAAFGSRDASVAAFAQLGQSACDTGRVALAVACARWLAGRDAARAKQLTDHIVELHGAGSKRIDDGALPPPLVGDITTPVPVGTTTREAAIAHAERAVAGAAKHAAALAERALAPTPLVSTLGRTPLRAFIGAMTVRAVPAGTVVIDVGQPAQALFWLARGRAEVSRDGTVLGELVPGGFFGEIALLAGSTRSARVTTLSDAWLLEIPTAAVEEAASKEPRVAEVLAQHARTRLLANLMRTSELFAALSPDDRAELLPRFESVFIPAGETVIREGAENELLYVLVSGRCDIRTGGKTIAQLGPGSALGEMSLFSNQPATADVVAVEASTALRLSRREFQQIAAKYPEVLAEVYKLVIAREEANRAIVHDATDLVV